MQPKQRNYSPVRFSEKISFFRLHMRARWCKVGELKPTMKGHTMNNVIELNPDNELSDFQTLSNDELKSALIEAVEAKKAAADYEALVKAEIINRYNDEINAALAAKDEPFGTVKVDDLEFNLPKRVDWDQDGLKAIHDDIAANGSDPSEYLTVKFGVKEAAFKNWPSVIKDAFIAARTVKPGAMTVKVKGE